MDAVDRGRSPDKKTCLPRPTSCQSPFELGSIVLWEFPAERSPFELGAPFFVCHDIFRAGMACLVLYKPGPDLQAALL